MHTRRGFTLVELLVVIAIIGILSAIVLVSLNNTKVKGRDVKRKSDLHQIQAALELYNTYNGRYPISSSPWACSATTNASNCSRAAWDSLATALKPYIATLPNDPINTNVSDPSFDGNLTYAYYSSPGGEVYDLIALLENQGDTQKCSSAGYINDVYSKQVGATYYWCAPFSPNNGRSAYIISDH